MKKQVGILGLLSLGACASGVAIATVLTAIQPVASALACDAQAVANAQGNATASFIAGTFCNDLAPGAALPVAVATLAGQTASLPTSSGTSVTLPVPAAVGLASVPLAKP